MKKPFFWPQKASKKTFFYNYAAMGQKSVIIGIFKRGKVSHRYKVEIKKCSHSYVHMNDKPVLFLSLKNVTLLTLQRGCTCHTDMRLSTINRGCTWLVYPLVSSIKLSQRLCITIYFCRRKTAGKNFVPAVLYK